MWSGIEIVQWNQVTVLGLSKICQSLRQNETAWLYKDSFLDNKRHVTFGGNFQLFFFLLFFSP